MSGLPCKICCKDNDFPDNMCASKAIFFQLHFAFFRLEDAEDVEDAQEFPDVHDGKCLRGFILLFIVAKIHFLPFNLLFRIVFLGSENADCFDFVFLYNQCAKKATLRKAESRSLYVVGFQYFVLLQLTS